jgi:hypothetical protein
VYENGEQRNKKNGNGTYTAWTVVYRAQVRLTVKDTSGQPVAVFEDAAAGDSPNQPSLGDAHDMAMKTSLSQALKRCAVNLGDQFGLSLYNDGSRDAVVMRSLAYMGEPVRESEDAPVRPEPTPQMPTAVPDQTSEDGQAPPPADPPTASAPVDNERQAALDEMRQTAVVINFADGLPAQFQATFGHPIEQGTTAEFREATALMRGTTAA